MVFFVEVRRVGQDQAGPAEVLREWLQRQGIEARGFEHSCGGPGMTFRIGFTEEKDAIAFATAFQGRLIGTEAPASNLWAAPECIPASAASGSTTARDPEEAASNGAEAPFRGA